MIRRLLKDSIFYTLSAAIPAATGLLLLPFYARKLGPREFGLLDATTVMLTLIGTVVALEIAQGVARYLPESDSTATRRRIGSTAFWFTASVFAAASLALWFSAPWLARAVLGVNDNCSIIRTAALALFSGSLQGIAIRHLRWSLRARSYMAAVALTNLVTAGIGIALVLRWRPAAEALFLGQTGGNLVGFSLAWLLANKELGWTWDSTVLRRMLCFSAPLVISTMGVIATNQLGRLMLARLSSMEEAGIFGIAARLASILGLLASGLQLAIGPLIYSAHEKKETPAALAEALRIFAALALIFWMILVSFAPEIVGLLSSSAFSTASSLVAPLGGAIVLSSSLAFAPGLEIKHRTGILALAYLVGGAINLLLCALLIGPWGGRGAGIAALSASAAQATLVFYLSQKHYFVPHAWKTLAACAVLALGGTYLSTRDYHLTSSLLFVKIGCITIASFPIAWLLIHPLRTRVRAS